MRRGTGAANRAGAAQVAASNAVFARPGYWDPVERLKDMDTDGVATEVLYTEVSAFRYLSDITEGVAEAIRAFNDTLYEFSQKDPERLVVSYQIPIHDIGVAVNEVRRVVSDEAPGCCTLLMPKSRILTQSSSPSFTTTKQFAGFMSRWMMPIACAD